ncbi:MAG: efflux RND transporter permease subunit [bacterium]
MALSEFFLKKRIFTFILMGLLIYMGVNALLSLQIETLPEVSAPVIFVAAPLPGGAPEEIETLITNPIEKKIMEIDDVERVMSSSWQNVSLTVVFFKDSVKPEEKFKEFREKVAEVRAQLPAETMDPIIEEVSFENLPMMFLGFKDVGKSQYELSRRATRIKRELESLQGVKKVVMTGATDKRVEVEVNPAELQKYGTEPLKTLLDKLGQINTNMPGGKLSLFGTEYTVRTIGKFTAVDDLKNLVVGVKDNQAISLSQIADIMENYPDPDTIVHVDGKRGVTLAIMKKKGYGTIKVADRIKETLTKYKDVVIMSDSSQTVRSQMSDLRNHALYGVVLVMLVLFVFLGFRVAAIVSFALPMTILMTFSAMLFKGMTLDMVSLFSLLLALGMMVDNSIVVCENIFRHMGLGKTSMQAALDATKEVGWPILSSTGAVVAAFLPMAFFLGGPIGEFTKPIPIVVTFALIASLVVANCFNPILCNTFIKSVTQEEEKKPGGFAKFGISMKNGYGRVVSWCLDNSGFVMAAAGALLAACVLLIVFKVVGLQLFPQLDTAKFYIDVKTPAGSTMQYTTEAVKKIEDMFDKSKYVKNYITDIGSSGTRVEIDDNIYFGSNIARLIVDLRPMDEIKTSHKKVIEDFRYRVNNMFDDETTVVFAEKMLGPPIGAPINIQVSGPDYDELKKVSDEIKTMLEKEKGVIDLKDNYPGKVPQIVLRANQKVLGKAGLTTRDVGGFIFLGLTGYKIGEIMLGEEKKDIFLRIRQSGDAANLAGQSFTMPNGETMMMSDILPNEMGEGLGGVEHENGKRTVTISANVSKELEPKRVVDKLKISVPKMMEALKKKDPAAERVSVVFAGETMLLNKALGDLTKALFVSLALIYLILLLEFRSTLKPLIILICVPYALVGVIIGLLIHGYAFSILAGIGLLCLIGIVVNNGIIYIDYANLLQERGMSIRAACIEACMTRVRPIILTKLTVILGILPLAMASASKTQFWKPLCLAIIWGLIIATTLTLIIIPVSYYVTEGWRERYYSKRTHLAPGCAPRES